jgi:hypothetical protein
MKRGGKLVAGGSWSVDSGEGMDDMLYVISSEGEVIVYVGTDPSSASTWELQGVYEMPRPSGARCAYQVGGDVLLITEGGLIPLSKVITLDKAVMSSEAITVNIKRAYNDRTENYFSNFGWQIVTKPLINMAILNIPTAESSTAEQFVMNTQTGAWSRWTGLDAICWAEFSGEIYFGTAANTVVKAEIGASDNDVSIQSWVVWSYDDWGSLGVKHVKGVRPIMSSTVDSSPGTGVVFDYEDPTSPPPGQATSAITGFTWDVSNWDEASWPGEAIYRRWRGASGVGVAVAPQIAVDISGSAAEDLDYRILAVHVMYESGSIRG